MEQYVLYYDSLYHHGVKGMRWGIRRYQNADGTLTTLGRQRLTEKGVRMEDNLIEKTIPKGTKMYRVTPDEVDSSSSKHKYVTYMDADRNLYKEGSLVKNYQDKSNSSDVYEHEFELKTDIRIPSLKTMREVESKVVQNEKLKAEVGRAWTESFLMSSEGYTAKQLSELSDIAKKMDKIKTDDDRRQLRIDLEKRYGSFKADDYYWQAESIQNAKNWVSSDRYLNIEQSLGRATNTRSAIIRELQKQGYNAMYDNASIGVESSGKFTKNQEGIEPLLIFDGKATLQETSTRRIDVNEQREAGKQYNEWREEHKKTLKKYK